MSLAAAPLSRAVPGLALSVSIEDGATLIDVRGEADAATAPALMEVLVEVIADHDGDVVVDLSQADFMDSATVRALARAGQSLRDRRRQLSLRSPSRLAMRVLAIHDVFHLLETPPGAAAVEVFVLAPPRQQASHSSER